MWYQAVGEGMMAEILVILICITVACFRCVKQCEADRMVIRLVPSIFAVVHHRYTITSVTVGQVGPILCIYFVSRFGIVATFDASDAQVIRSLFVFKIEREFGFQQCVGRLPVYFVIEVDAFCTATFIQTYVLTEDRFSVTFLDTKRFT